MTAQLIPSTNYSWSCLGEWAPESPSGSGGLPSPLPRVGLSPTWRSLWSSLRSKRTGSFLGAKTRRTLPPFLMLLLRGVAGVGKLRRSAPKSSRFLLCFIKLINLTYITLVLMTRALNLTYITLVYCDLWSNYYHLSEHSFTTIKV